MRLSPRSPIVLALLVIASSAAGCGSGSGPHTVTDESGALSMEVRRDWDADGAPVELPAIPEIGLAEGSPNAALVASTDIEGCEGALDRVCVDLVASVDIAVAVGSDPVDRILMVPEVFAAISDRASLKEECESRASALVEDAAQDSPVQALSASFEGVVDVYSGCGELGSTVYELAAFATGRDVFVLGRLVSPTDDDRTALRDALGTLEIDDARLPRS